MAITALAVGCGQLGLSSGDEALGDSDASSALGTDPIGDETTTSPSDQQNEDDGSTTPADSAAGADALPSTAAEPGDYSAPPVEWHDCGGGFQCGEVIVPIDHAKPTGETMPIALVRLPAAAEARGSIFVNPGGPGASGIDYVRNGFRFDSATSEVYNLIGFDPRGIGQSRPLVCGPDRTQGPIPDFSPDDATEAASLDAAAAELADACTAADPLLIEHVDTESVARDLDHARAAVGDDRLHFYGLSFGTLIGQVYADLFPSQVGHMVLDGVVDPTAPLVAFLAQQSIAFERSFEVVDNACGQTLQCPDEGVIATYDRVLADLERTGPHGQVGPAEFEYAALVTLYNERLWPIYVEALGAAEQGDFSGIDELSDLFLSGTNFATYAAVECSDGPRPDGLSAWDDFADDLSADAPRFGAIVANELRTCAVWPVEAGPARAPVVAPGAPPILVIGNTNDPATPLANAQLVAQNLERASLVIFEADRHTAYRASSCIAGLVRDYFIDDQLPISGHRCTE